ncbi:MAG: substrate-binding domain-containing protein [Thermoplasmata archaeon]|nr:substrate-binding domain-containing protein [Thermoplasmata archaeon]
MAVVTVVLAGSLGSAWSNGWLRSTPSSGSVAPSSPCTEPPVLLHGSLSLLLDPRSNVTFENLTSGFGNKTGHCATLGLGASPAGGDLVSLRSGAADFLVLGSAPTRAELAQLPDPALYLPEVLGAVEVIYHLPTAKGGLNLTPSALAGIYLGTVRNWSDPSLSVLNPGAFDASAGPLLPAYLAGDTAATTSLSEYLSAANRSWNLTIGPSPSSAGFHGTSVNGTEAMVRYVASTPGALGYVGDRSVTDANVGIARLMDRAGDWASPNSTGLTNAAIAVGGAILNASALPGRSLAPGPDLTAANASGSWSYPLTTFDYVVLYQDLGPGHGGGFNDSAALWLLSFLLWMANGGQTVVAGFGFLPLPGLISALTVSILEKVTYDGKNVLSGNLGGGEGSGEGGNETGG